MGNFLLGFQIVIAVALAGAILVQVKGTGFGRVWGGLGNSFSRRGVESLVFKLTFVLAFLFILVSTAAVIF
jgi:protein translocase SecG subunit